MTTSVQSRLGEAPEEGIKAPVRAVSSGNLALFDVGMTIAGYVVQDNDRICANGQTDATQNGIYVARQGRTWERATDFNLTDDVVSGQLMVDNNTSSVYSISVTPEPWQPGVGTVNFGLLLTPVGFFWGSIGGTLSDQGDLQAALDAKTDLGHTHTESDITDLQAYALIGHTHVEADITDLQNYALVGHTHVEADILDLQAYLLDAPGSIGADDEYYARRNGNWESISTAAGTVGEIVAWPHEDIPQDFLACDGQSYNAVTFAALFAVIGYRYGGSGANFNVPDLRGEFIRGWANGSGNDPDRASRTDSGDGTVGDFVGTKQDGEFASHQHNTTIGKTASSTGAGGASGQPAAGVNTTSAGGSETRPRNVYMQYIIRYSGGGSGDALPPSITIQDNGVEVTSAVELMNFLNFTINQPVANQVEIAFGVSKAAGIYSPGYSSYTRVDDDEFTIDLINAEQLFYVGRRVRFTDDMGAFTFGNITAVDFNVTSANDTHITLLMDASEVVPTTITDVSLVSSSTQWSPIAADPFSGNPIRDAVYGVIGGTSYIFAVGGNGLAGYSTDGGLNWTMLTTGTTERMNCCTFDSNNEEFWAGGNNGVLLSWDGTTVTLDTTSIPALTITGNGHINGFAYSTTEDGLALLHERDTGSWRVATSTDQGGSWTNTAGLGGIPSNDTNNLAMGSNSPGSFGDDFYACLISNSASRVLSNLADTSFAVADSLGGGNMPIAMEHFHDGTNQARFYGDTDGDVFHDGFYSAVDNVTFTTQLRGFAWSSAHGRLVVVGDNQQIGYLDLVDINTNDAWTAVANGFDPLANIFAVVWDPVNGNFCAFADNGQICRSSNGTN
jgi:microcystin-dependent protein